VLQLALNVGQGLAMGTVKVRYSLDDFVVFDE
jgi:hypothetical protein